LGDLEEDSPLPFNIPLYTSNTSSSGNYLVPLKVEYYDDLRNQYVIYESDIVNVSLPQQPVNENQDVGSLFSTSNPMGLVILVVLMKEIIIILRFLHTRSKKKKMAKLNANKNNSNFIDLLDNAKKTMNFGRKKIVKRKLDILISNSDSVTVS
jgi:hypothetical protein